MVTAVRWNLQRKVDNLKPTSEVSSALLVLLFQAPE